MKHCKCKHILEEASRKLSDIKHFGTRLKLPLNKKSKQMLCVLITNSNRATEFDKVYTKLRGNFNNLFLFNLMPQTTTPPPCMHPEERARS